MKYCKFSQLSAMRSVSKKVNLQGFFKKKLLHHWYFPQVIYCNSHCHLIQIGIFYQLKKIKLDV